MRWRDAVSHVMRSIRQEADPVPAVPDVEPAPAVAFTPVTEGEVQAAIAVLYAPREGVRKRQRRRRGVTYKQRDQIAHLILRMWHNREREHVN